MRLQIIGGAGMVGNAVAYRALVSGKVKALKLIDISTPKLEGVRRDLCRARDVEGVDCEIVSSWHVDRCPYDWNIICAGQRYEGNESVQFHRNFPLVLDYVKQLKNRKILIVTNPARSIYESICTNQKPMWKQLMYAGDMIDKCDNGRAIHGLKGYTDVAIASEVWKMIRDR